MQQGTIDSSEYYIGFTVVENNFLNANDMQKQLRDIGPLNVFSSRRSACAITNTQGRDKTFSYILGLSFN